jgi:uncharacterized membrane protein YbhN (UPF0104 family)
LDLKNKKTFSLVIKVAILFSAFIFIFNKLSNNNNLAEFNQLLKGLSHHKVYSVLILVFLLMLLNWFLEALKWKYLIKGIEKISVWKAVESVFCGLTLAVFTPNRIGEYGGRVFFLTPRKRLFGLVAMGVGAIGQMVVTNVLGGLSILWFIGNFFEINFWLFYGLIFLVTLFCLFFIVFYFNIKWVYSLLSSILFLKRFKKFFKLLSRYQKKELWNVFLFCIARFIVFTTQYCLIINLLLPELQLFAMVMMILILFFIQSALPSLDLLDVGVRSMTATYFFSFITHQEVAIMASTAWIWLVNLIIPAILGSVFVFKLNFFGIDHK